MAIRPSAGARSKSRNLRSGKSSAQQKTGSALYLYAITRQKNAAKAPLMSEGIDGQSPVSHLACSGFTCWISRVSRAEFAGSLARRMEDLDWLARAGARHQHVVAALAARGDVLPARFGTIFLTESSLAKDVATRKATLIAAFRRVTAADEWGIKIFAIPQAPPDVPTGESGAAYLRRKSAAAGESSRPRVLEPAITRFAASLGRLARSVAPGGAVTQSQPQLLWHGSFLIPRARRSALEHRVQQFARHPNNARRYRIEITGPWPPYSFVKHAD